MGCVVAAEQILQTKILQEVNSWPDGYALKVKGDGSNGFPDVFITTTRSGPFTVEVKAPGQKPKPHQVVMHHQLERCGCRAFVCDSWQEWMRAKDAMGLL